jgi:hypothetical protein
VRLCILVSAVLLIVISTRPVAGQTFGVITGEVHDTSGAVIAGAAVVVTNEATGATRNTVANEVGTYSFPSLPPGTYDLKVSTSGFQTVTRNNVELQVQQTARVDFTLELGQQTQVVEVTGGAPLVTTEDATIGTVIENRRIVELPLNGRNFLSLVSLAPNVTSGFGATTSAIPGQVGDRANLTAISVGGQRPMFNHFTLDGLENTFVEGNTYEVLPSIDALQEFKVQTGIYPAEFGREVTQINVSTKAGGNDYHGTLFEFLRNDVLDAKIYAFGASRPDKEPFKWNQFGFTLGGPISIPKLFNGKNKLFFMANYEGFRERQAIQNVATVPTAAMRAGNFSAPGIPTIYDPLTRVTQASGTITASPFAGNIIPANRIAPTSTKLLQFLPLPNQPGSALASDYQAGALAVINRDQFNLRTDFVESSRSSWFGRYSWGNESQFGPGLFPLIGQTVIDDPWQALISNTRVFSPSLVNEARFGVVEFANNTLPETAYKVNGVGELAIPGLAPSADPAGWGIPNITVTGISSFGSPSSIVSLLYSTTFQWVDNVTWIHRNHSLRFGAEIRRDRFNPTGQQFGAGGFTFGGQATQDPAISSSAGYGTADLMLGDMSLARQGVKPFFGQFRATSQAYYIDDSWKVRPNLTITLGLRYEFTPPYYDKSQNFANVLIPFWDDGAGPITDQSLHPTLVRIGSGNFYQGLSIQYPSNVQVARNGSLGPDGIFPDYKDWAPRLGIAWSKGRWTVRTGAGVFYSQDATSTTVDVARNTSGTQVVQANASTINLNWSDPYLNGGNTSQNLINMPQYLATDPHRLTPRTVQLIANIQREISKDTVLEVGYVGALGRRLEQYRAINAASPSPTGTQVSRVNFPELAVIYLVDAVGKSDYDALSAKLQRRFSGGLTYLASYTWSKSIDTGSGIRTPAGDTQEAQNDACIQCDRALSAFNAAHRFVMSTLYELPFGKGRRFLDHGGITNAVVGNWQLSSILTLQTGFPLNIVDGKNQTNDFITSIDRPNATGQTLALPRGQQDPQKFFNTGAVALEPFGTFGNLGRNVLIGPGIINLDFAAMKSIPILESRRLELRFESFNATNHPNWGTPDVTLLDAAFGKVTTTRTPMRQLQGSLKFYF